MHRKVASVILGSMAVVSASTAFGTQLYSQSFDYTLGTTLAEQSGWIGQSQSGTDWYDTIVDGLSFDGVASSGGAVSLYERGIITLPSIGDLSSSNFYISSLMQKTNDSGFMGITLQQGWNQPNVAGFGITAPNPYYSFTSGGLYLGSGYVGWPQDGNGPFTTTPDVPTNTTGLLVAYVDQTAKTISLWNVTSLNTTSLGDPTLTFTYGNETTPTIGAVQVFSSWGATGMIDEIRIGTELSDVITFVTPSLVGDTNNDGVVDISDYNNVINNFGLTTGGDTNNDGIVDVSDYNNVINNFGASAATALVPEPASMGLLAIGALGLLRRRR